MGLEIINYTDNFNSGIKLSMVATNDDNIEAKCNQYNPWRVSLNVLCDENPKQNNLLHVENFFIIKDSMCNINVFAIHRAGCGMETKSAIENFLQSRPVLNSCIMISFGIAACFFGGKIINYILFGLSTIMAFNDSVVFLS